MHNTAHEYIHDKCAMAVQGGHVACLLPSLCRSMGFYLLFPVAKQLENSCGLTAEHVTDIREATPVGERGKVRQNCF